jgi:hypothetical protein
MVISPFNFRCNSAAVILKSKQAIYFLEKDRMVDFIKTSGIRPNHFFHHRSKRVF